MSDEPARAFDAPAVRAWVAAALVELAAARAEIDALNVYPVPDGDTGTNLLLTFRSAAEALADLPADSGPAAVLDRLARGALLGARGNSGVILSQVLRGLADSLAGRTPDASAFAKALAEAADAAYRAVAEPVEGTMLTVLRSASVAARDASDLPGVAAAAASAARAALARTPDQLDVLRRAGVVDAGGRGVCVLLDVLERVMAGGPDAGAGSSDSAVAGSGARAAEAPVAVEGPAYEVMFLLDAPADAIPPLREALTSIGNSVAVVGDAAGWHVHAHVDDVRTAIRAGLSAGEPHGVRVTSLRNAGDRADPATRPRAVVAVVDSAGVADLFEAAGAAVVATDASRSACATDVLAVLHAVGAHELVVLPTDDAGHQAAQDAAERARRQGLRVEVVPSRGTVPALAALAVQSPASRFEDDVSQMTAAAQACRHGAVIGARHAVDAVDPRNLLGVVGEEVVVSGASAIEVSCALVDHLLDAGGDTLTLIARLDQGRHVADAVADHVRRTRQGIEIGIHYACHQAVLLVGVE